MLLLLWPLCGIGQAIIFLSCGFIFLFFFFSSPILSRRRLDVSYFHAWCGLSLKRATRSSLKIQDAKNRQKIGHMRTVAQLCRGYIFATKAHIGNQEKLF